MFSLVIFVLTMVAITYFWHSPPRVSGGSRTSRFEDNNPFRGRFTKAPPRPFHGTIDKGGMTRCHNCSCFFPETRVINDVVEGHILEFCSESCRLNFHAPRR